MMNRRVRGRGNYDAQLAFAMPSSNIGQVVVCSGGLAVRARPPGSRPDTEGRAV
jgi:hypothetical protein